MIENSIESHQEEYFVSHSILSKIELLFSSFLVTSRLAFWLSNIIIFMIMEYYSEMENGGISNEW